jgi:hypothetical protein
MLRQYQTMFEGQLVAQPDAHGVLSTYYMAKRAALAAGSLSTYHKEFQNGF